MFELTSVTPSMGLVVLVRLSELETYKKSLIFEYVTGKKEVPTLRFELSHPLQDLLFYTRL